MQDLNGFMTPNGAVCLTGIEVEARMAAAKAAGKMWPWDGPVMIGDTRAAVSWPDRTVTGGTVSPTGCMAIGMLDPMGKMRVVTMRDFDRVRSSADASGKVREGIALMLRDAASWGVRDIVVQADDMVEAATWWELIRKDPSLAGVKFPVDTLIEIPRALSVWREMAKQCIVPRDYATKIEQADTRGDILPMTKAIAMLCMSFKFKPEIRIQANDFRWDAWR